MSGVELVARLALGAVFLIAAVAKLLDLEGTRGTLRAFGVRDRAVAPGALALPAAEVAAGLLLIVAPVAGAGAAAALALLAGFSVAVGRVLRAGEAPACHCFGSLSGTRVGRGTLARNAVLAVLAVVVLVGGAGADVSGWLSLLVALGAGAVAIAAARRVPGRVGSRAPAWSADGRRGPVVLVFISPGCGPCAALLEDLPRWGFAEALRLVVVSAGPASAVAGLELVEQADDALARRYGVHATPTAIAVDADGRIASRGAAGAVEIGALVRARAAGRHEAELGTRTMSAYGVPLTLRADEPAALGALVAALPAAAHPAPDGTTPGTTFTLLSAGTGASVHRDHALVHRTDRDVAQSVEALAAAVRLHVAEHAPEHVFVHAGVVAWRGRAVVVPGRSFTGKSTLTAAFLRAGAVYMSDEYAVLDEAGLVHPYVKPIALRDDGGHISQDYAIAEFTALEPQEEPVPLGAVLKAPYEADARWEAVPTTTAAGCMVLMENCVGIRAAPRRTLATVRAAGTGAVALDGARGDADETARAVLDYLDRAFGISTASTASSQAAPSA